jgi:ligand-binding SRPBCC domain-containing protein
MHFRFEQFVPLPAANLFAFHENPQNLLHLYHGWAATRLIDHDAAVRPGCRTWIEVTAGRILPVALGFEHTTYEPPIRFGERLIHGPFRRFDHVHEFEPRDGGTVVRDLIEVELPWCYGGEPAMRILIAPLVRSTFARRQASLLRLAQSGGIPALATPSR